MARASVDNPDFYINRELSWLQFNHRVLEEAQDENNPLLERLKFLSISANNLDEFFEVRVSGLVQQIEDGYTEAGPDGLTLLEERDLVAEELHKFVGEQYQCWNEKLRPQLAEKGIRVLSLHELDDNARAFVQDYCERELDLLLTPVTIDPAHPFPRVINKALCVGFLLRRRRRSSLTYTGVVTVPRALPRLVRLPSEGTTDFIFLADLVAFHAARMYSGYDIVSSAAVSRHPQQQSLSGGRRIAQPAGVCAHRIAQPAQGRCGAAGDRSRGRSRRSSSGCARISD